MPDIPNRDELERILARAVGKELASEFDDLLDALGDPPDPANLPIGFWDDKEKEMRAVIEPMLVSTYLASAEVLVAEITIGVEWGAVNEAAIEWVRNYTFDLVRGITDTTQGVLQKAVETYFRDGLSKKELAQLLEPSFGPVRAELIATTETTRASVEAERDLVRTIERDNENIKMIPIWQTANDERVCEICGPRHGKPIEDGIYPPAHPRCRCWVNYEPVVIEK